LATQTPTPTDAAESSSLPAVLGGVLSGVLVIVALVVAALLLWRRRRSPPRTAQVAGDFQPEMSQEKMTTFKAYEGSDLWNAEEPIVPDDHQFRMGFGIWDADDDFGPGPEEAIHDGFGS
jgi:hypothetical protein